MALLGQGVAAIWHNVPHEIEADYNHWHGQEHVPERVGIAGFLRGRRYVALSGTPKYFHFYETVSLETLTSTPYLTRLNNPTAWTARLGPMIRDNIRTLSRVHSSVGTGTGAVMLTARMSVAPAKRRALASALSDKIIPTLCKTPGIIGAHLLEGDATASGTPSQEKTLRGVADGVADLVLMVDAPEQGLLESVQSTILRPEQFIAGGATETAVGTYQLLMELNAQELSSQAD